MVIYAIFRKLGRVNYTKELRDKKVLLCYLTRFQKRKKTERFSCLKEGAYPFRAGRQG